MVDNPYFTSTDVDEDEFLSASLLTSTAPQPMMNGDTIPPESTDVSSMFVKFRALIDSARAERSTYDALEASFYESLDQVRFCSSFFLHYLLLPVILYSKTQSIIFSALVEILQPWALAVTLLTTAVFLLQ